MTREAALKITGQAVVPIGSIIALVIFITVATFRVSQRDTQISMTLSTHEERLDRIEPIITKIHSSTGRIEYLLGRFGHDTRGDN
jgi:hypothetical protein